METYLLQNYHFSYSRMCMNYSYLYRNYRFCKLYATEMLFDTGSIIHCIAKTQKKLLAAHIYTLSGHASKNKIHLFHPVSTRTNNKGTYLTTYSPIVTYICFKMLQ